VITGSEESFCSEHGNWHGGIVIVVSNSQLRGHGFNSQPLNVTVLGKLFTHRCLCYPAV